MLKGERLKRSLALWVVILLAPALGAQEWARYRGLNGSGVSEAEGIPTEWTERDPNWRVELPGIGHSQPVLWGEKIFLTSAEKDGGTRAVLCLRTADGSVEWQKDVESRTFRKHWRNSYASSTPCVDQKRVYAVFSTPASYVISAFDHGGKEIWSRDLGAYKSQHGDGASPILFEDLVILGNEQDGESWLVALDRMTGEPRWKTPRVMAEVSYTTPCAYLEEDGRPALLFSSHAHGLASVDARSGKPNWEAKVFDKRTVASPIFAGGLALGTCGSGGGGSFLVAVRPGGKGDVTESRVAYRLTKAMPYVPTPVARGEFLFTWNDLGVVSCAEISTVVVAAGKEFKVLARNPLGEGSRSTPAVAGGRMYLRTFSHLISVGGKKGVN